MNAPHALRGRKNVPRPRPLESFDPRLKNLLLAGAERAREMYAEEDKSPPENFPKNFDLNSDIDLARVVNTRWHQCVFSSAAAAQRFKGFLRLAQRLHHLRLAMKEAKDADTKRVYNVLISVEDRTGCFRVSPSDAPLDELLNELVSQTSFDSDFVSEAPEGFDAEQDLSSGAQHHVLFSGDDDPLNAI